MTVDTLLSKGTATVFPAAEIEATLRDALLSITEGTAGMHGISLPDDKHARYAAAIPLDSLDVVDTLLALEPIVGFELKDQLVRAGGYPSINAAVTHLMPRIHGTWNKHALKGAKS